MPIDHDTSELLTMGAALTRHGVMVGRKAAAVVRSCGALLEATGKELAAVDTGFMRGSIGTDYTGSATSTEMSAVCGPTASYAPFVEWGTYRMAPQPFMGPALDRVAPVFVAGMEAATEVAW